MTDDEFDALLARRLREPALPDGGFSDLVRVRLRQHRRVRRVAIGGIAVITMLAALVAAAVLPSAGSAVWEVPLQDIVATLILAAACCLIWLATESNGLGLVAWTTADGTHRKESER